MDWIHLAHVCTVLGIWFHKMWGIPWLADQLSASGEGCLFHGVHYSSWPPQQNGDATTCSPCVQTIILCRLSASLVRSTRYSTVTGLQVRQARTQLALQSCSSYMYVRLPQKLHHSCSHTRRIGAPPRGSGEGGEGSQNTLQYLLRLSVTLYRTLHKILRTYCHAELWPLCTLSRLPLPLDDTQGNTL
jgi:hypothetical protein